VTNGTRLGVALAAGAAIVLTAPFVGQIRGALQAALPEGAYRALVAAAVLGAVLGGVGYALARIRDDRRGRYGRLALAIAAGVTYAWWSSSGNISVDLVEHFHFVEYGLLTLLFYRVWRHAGGALALVAPALCALMIGTLDEWLQWFVPLRVGEMRDVALNGVAIGCGLLFATGLEPMPQGHGRRLPDVPRAVRLLPATALLTVACFFHVVHLAYDVDAGQGTRFRSRFTSDQLDAESRARADRWRQEGPPSRVRRLSREDQYLAEGIWHVQRRNESAEAGDHFAAWKENVILERFFGPVLDTPSYAVPASPRWAAEQRASAAAAGSVDERRYVSEAERYPLYVWNRAAYWLVIGVVAGLLVVLAWPGARVAGSERTPAAV
jgi:hypothetical protein